MWRAEIFIFFMCQGNLRSRIIFRTSSSIDKYNRRGIFFYQNTFCVAFDIFGALVIICILIGSIFGKILKILSKLTK